MTNEQQLRHNGSNCPYRDTDICPWFLFDVFDDTPKECPESCREDRITQLEKCGIKGRRWLEKEVADGELRNV